MWTTRSQRKYEFIDLENLEDAEIHAALSYPTVQQLSVFEEASHLMKPEIVEESELPQNLYEAVNRGEDFAVLVAKRPDDVITILRDHAVTKIGEFQTNDSELLKAFEKKKMVTYAFDEKYREGFENTWKSILRCEGRKHLSHDGWHETMTVAVYCVNIKYAANVLGEGILKPLLSKAETEETGDTIWDFPCVRAVIEFKWTHWARKYLITEFLLYLGWLLCFVGFMTIYIETNLDKGFQRHMDKEDKILAILAYVLDAGAFLFMCPFLIIEYNAIKHYGWKWMCTWKILHSVAFVLQVLVSVLHFSHTEFKSQFFVCLLATHCTLLFIKVQYFARVMDPVASYVETLKTLIFNVRYFLLFIVLSMISAALSFSALYKWEIDREEKDADFEESLADFKSLPRSSVTAYSMLLGNFESAYLFNTNNNFFKCAFFLFFQLFMSITVINLLIAVMTESYKTVMKKKNIIYHRCKAQIIDELELSLPKMLYPRFKRHVHFVVCEKPKTLQYELSTLGCSESTKDFENEMRNELKALRKIVE